MQVSHRTKPSCLLLGHHSLPSVDVLNGRHLGLNEYRIKVQLAKAHENILGFLSICELQWQAATGFAFLVFIQASTRKARVEQGVL